MKNKEIENLKNEYFECACHCNDHLMIACLNREDNELYIQMHLLPHKNIFRRMWLAVKYIFGYRSKFGDYEEFIFNNDDAERLIAILKELKKYEKRN